MAKFDNDQILQSEEIKFPNVDLRSPEIKSINPNLGSEPIGFGNEPLTNSGIPSLQIPTVQPEVGFDRPFSTVSSGTLLENQRYPKYQRDVDLEEAYARTQPWYKQMGNGAVKMGLNLVGGIANQLMTIPDTISAVKDQDLSKLTGKDNPIEVAVSNWTNAMENEFPNYISKYEREHPFKAMFGTGFANFIGNDILKNVGVVGGFVGGAILQDAAVGAVTGLLGEIPMVANQVGKLSLGLNKLFTGTNDSEKLLSLLEKETVLTGEQISNVKKVAELSAATRVKDGFRYALAQYGTARTMGAIDARETYGEVKNKLIDEYKLKNSGNDPQGKDLEEIEQYATDAMNTRFGIDFTLSLASGALQFDNLFKSFGKTSKSVTNAIAQDIEGVGKIGLKEGSLDVAEAKGATTVSGKLWESVKPRIPNIFAESVITMGGLYASGKFTEDYYTNKYKDLKDPNNKKTFDELNQFIKSVNYALGEQFGSAEGQQAMFVGALLGLGIHAVGSAVDRARGVSGNERLQASIDTINKHGITSILRDSYTDTLNSVNNAKEMEQAVKENNIFKYKNLQHDNLFNLVTSRLRLGLHDFTIEQLEMLKGLDKEQFEKYFGVDFSESNKKTVGEYVDKLIEHANDIKKTYDAVSGTFKNPFEYFAKEDTDEKRKSNDNHYQFEKWKLDITYYSSLSKDTNERIESIQQKLYDIHPELNNNVVARLVNSVALSKLAKSYEERAKTLNGTISDEMTADEKQDVKDQVKAYRTFSEKINAAIANKDMDLKTFHELLNFELNANDRKAEDVVGFEHASEIYKSGVDLNALANRKRTASEAVDALTTKEGFEKYFQRAQEMNSDQKMDAEDFQPTPGGGGLGTGEKPEAEVTVPTFTNKAGEVEGFEIGRSYQTEKFAEPKITKIDDDRWEVSIPDGAKTYYNTEEKAKAKVNEIKQDYADLAKVKVIGFNEDGTIKVEDVNGDIQNIPAEAFRGYEKVETRQEKLIKFAAEVGKMQDELEKNSGDIATGSDEDDIKAMAQASSFEDMKKSAAKLFLSTKTESEDWDDPTKSAAHIKQSREFLNTAAYLPNRADLQAILVHYGNEGALGLSGLTQLSYGPNFPKDVAQLKDLHGGFLAQVFVTKDGYFIDKAGNKIGKVGEPVDVNKVVFQTMPTTSPTGIDNKGKVYDLHRKNEKEAAAEARNQYIELRKRIFADDSASPMYSDFNVSPGIGIELLDGKERNNVTDTLLPTDKKLAERLINTHKGLIVISKDGRIQHQGESIKIPKGRPVFQYGDTVVPLNNAKLTPSRVNAVFEILKQVSDNIGTISKVTPQLEFLQHILYYKRGGKTKSANQISIDEKTMDLYIGDNKFDISDVANNEKEIKEKLADIYTNINADGLEKNFNKKFREFYIKEGELTSNVWDNYQTYLLSSKYPDGSARPDSDIPLKTSIAARTEAAPVNFKQRYSTIRPTDLPYKAEKPAEQKVETTVETEEYKEVVKQANGVIEALLKKAIAANPTKFNNDGETPNKASVGRFGELEFTIDGKGNLGFDTESKQFLDIRDSIVKALQPIPEEEIKPMAPPDVVAEKEKFPVKDLSDLISFYDPKTGKEKAFNLKELPKIWTEKYLPEFEQSLKNVTNLSELINAKEQFIKDNGSRFPLFQAGINKSKTEKIYYDKLESLGYLHENYYINDILLEWAKRTRNGMKVPLVDFLQNVDLGKEYSDIEIKPTTTPLEKTKEDVQVDPNKFKGTAPKDDYKRVGVDPDTSVISDADLAVLKRWHAENVPGIPYEVLENIIKTHDGADAFGVFTNNVAKFYRGAPKGTEYHELFHGIFNGFLNEGQREAIREEFRANTGSFTDRATGENINYGDATDEQIEEKLADDFGDFRKGKAAAKSFGQRVLDFFRSIINFFKSFVSKPSLKDKLFKDIDTGKFKKSKLTNTGEVAKYRRIEGLSAKQTSEFVQDMALRAKNFLFGEEKENIYNFKKITGRELFDKIEQAYVEEGKRDKMSASTWNELVKRTKDSLRTRLGVKFNEEDVVDINNEEYNSKEYDRDPFTIGKRNASFGVKLGLMLPEVSNKATLGKLPARKMSSIDGYLQVPYTKAFTTIINTLSNTSDPSLAFKKLATLAKNDPTYVRVFNDLGGNVNDFTFDFSSLQKPVDWRYAIDFYQTFTKMNPEVSAHYINGNEVYIGAANLYTAAKSLQKSWVQNIRDLSKTKGALIKFDGETKTYSADPEVFKNTPIDNDVDKLNFLNKLGINITPDVFAIIDTKGQNKIINQASAIYEYLQDKKDLVTLKGETLDVKGRFEAIAEVIIKATNPLQDNVYTGIDGKTRQSNVQNNALSLLANRFNESDSLEALKVNRPELNDVFSTHSLTLKKGGMFFDKEGNKIEGQELIVGATNGVLDEVKDRGRAVTRLSLGQRFATEINENVNGWFYALNPADSKTEWKMNLGVHIPFGDIMGGIRTDIHKAFKGYLLDDVALALDYKERRKLANVGSKAKELRFFKDILTGDRLKRINKMIADNKTLDEITDYINKNLPKIETDIDNYLDESANILKEKLITNRQIRVSPVATEARVTYTFRGLEDAFARENGINKFDLTEIDVNDLVRFLDVNKTIANIEFHKILFGDPYQFKISEKNGKEVLDEMKRVKSFDSPAETTFNHPEFNNFHNIAYNKTGLFNDANRIDLAPRTKDSFGDIGYDLFKDYMNTATVNDVNIIGRLLGKTTENDAFSILRDTAYRQVKLRNTKWGDDAEANFQWHMAYTRNKLAAKGVYEYSSDKLRAHDDKLIDTPTPKYIREELKPIVRGNKYNSDKIDLVLDKDSQMPLYYKDVEGTVLEDLYIKMWKEDVDYIVAKSGRKMGAEAIHDLYVDGKFNPAPFNNNIQVPWSAYGIQVETTHDDAGGKVTFSVQVPKITSLDLFANGKPFTTDGVRAKAIQDEYTRGMDIKKALNKNGYDSLLTKLGLSWNGTSFDVLNRRALAETLNHEILRNDVSSNVMDTITLDDNGEFVIPFEATFSYKRIKDIVYSMLDKSITHPKVNGGSYVQTPVTMWENPAKGRRLAIKTDEGYKEITSAAYDKLPEDQKRSVVLTDDTLKFYTKEDPYCEVALPHWFGELIKKNKRFDTDEKVLKYLNTTKEGQEILRGVAFRMPVQGINSIEAYRVKFFLSKEMGKTVVVPSEITTKAGSDFDVDKLNFYLKNVYIDKNNDIKIVRHQGSEEATREFYGKVFDDITEGRKFRKAELLEAAQILSYDLEDPKGLMEKYAHILDTYNPETISDLEGDIMASLEKLGDAAAQIKLKEEFVSKKYRESLENEYYDHLEKMVTLPENFERLITPVSDAGLAKLADKIDDLENNKDEEIKNKVISSTYSTDSRHSFAMAKNWVGIIASNIAVHSITQKGNVYIDPARFKNVDEADQKILGDGKINIPHNSVEINGVSYPTLSAVMTHTGNTRISERLGGQMTAVVDIVKDPFILKIINSNLAPNVVMFLERLGTDETGLLFIKQPIIKDYLTDLDNSGTTSLYNINNIDYIKSLYPTTDALLKSTDTINHKDFEENIRKRNREGLGPKENAEQHLILDEFLKYAKMADYMSDTNQALTYDTARFSNGEALSKKQYRTQRALDNNIFAGVQELLDNTFLGYQAKVLDDGVNAIGEVLKLEGRDYSNITNKVLDPYMKNKYLGVDKFNAIANKIKMSFLDYIIQTKTDINDDINMLLADTSESVASQLAKAKENYPDLDILKVLQATPAVREGGARSISLKVNLTNDPSTEDTFTDYMRELRDNPGTNALFNNLVKVAILQGMYKSPVSIGNIIPVENFSESITPVINSLHVDKQLQDYTNGWFQRNNFRDGDIFTRIEPKFRVAQWSSELEPRPTLYYSTSYFPAVKQFDIASTDRKILTLSEKYNYLATKSDYVQFPRVINVTKKGKQTGELIDVATGKAISKKQMVLFKEKGVTAYKDLYNYQRVRNTDGSPFYIYENGERIHVYKLINVYGDGGLVSEYYDDFRKSSFNNGTIKVTEIPDDEIVRAMSYKAAPAATPVLPTTIDENDLPSQLAKGTDLKTKDFKC